MHFASAAEAVTPQAQSEQVPIRRHIDALWTLLTRDESVVAAYPADAELEKADLCPSGG
ncbi:MAG TPA: hypothetical protein VGG79_19425 [Roseiarcus sp.]|jgi:hypothetical protein